MNHASAPDSDGVLVEWYRDRVGDPATGDEVLGYWLFALGAVLGVVGILAFLPSRSASPLRQWALVLAAAGLALLLAGPVVRLPLRRAATWLVVAGLAICAAAVAWFVAAYPGAWSPETGQRTIIGLYALGALVVAVAGVAVPVLAGRPGGRPVAGETTPPAGDARGDSRGDGDDSRGDGTVGDQWGVADESQSRFEVYEDRGGEWRWRLRHRNGEIIADSGEGYTRRHDAQRALASVRRDAPAATVLVLGDEPAAPDEVFEPVVETASRATFEVYEDSAGEWRWRLVHDNGEVLADSGEGYASRRNAVTAVDRVSEYAAPADYLRPDPAAFEVYRDAAGEWRWRLVHRNGEVLADGGEGYAHRSGARRAVDALRERGEDFGFEVYEDRAGEHRWRLEAANGRVVADGGEGYATRAGAAEAVESVRGYAPEADVLDVGAAAFEVYEDGAGEWRWRLRHRNGEVLADGGEGYATRSGAWQGIESVKRNAHNADLKDAEA